jgi:hypothetical protein
VEKQLPLTEFVPVEFPAGTPLTGEGAAETLMDSAALSSGSNVAAVVSVVGAAASGLLAVDGFSEAADEQYAEAARDGVAGGQQGDGCGRGGLDVGDAVELALDIYEQLRPDDALPGVPWLSPGGGGCGGDRNDRTSPPQRDATRAGSGLDDVVRHGPHNPGPLADDVASTFRSGTYDAVTSSNPTTLYRVHGGRSGQLGPFWSRTRPTGGTQSIIDSALDPAWGNSATRWTQIEVPAGTTFYDGPAAPQRGLVGGGNQVYIGELIPDEWIVRTGSFTGGP